MWSDSPRGSVAPCGDMPRPGPAPSWALLLWLLALLRPPGWARRAVAPPRTPSSTSATGLRYPGQDPREGSSCQRDPAGPSKMIRHESKQIKMFKGFEKVTILSIFIRLLIPPSGVKLEANSQKQYLLTGQILSDGKALSMCATTLRPGKTLSLLQRESLNHHYHLNQAAKSRPAIRCPAPSRLPMSDSGQTGY